VARRGGGALAEALRWRSSQGWTFDVRRQRAMMAGAVMLSRWRLREQMLDGATVIGHGILAGKYLAEY
jgi:hypothetical protein